jgi:hypothetical protein
MSQKREPGFDRIVALVLRVGAFGCFFIMLAGLLVGIFVPGPIAEDIECAGVLLMLATPAVRVLVAGILFLREKEVRCNFIRSADDFIAGGRVWDRRTLKACGCRYSGLMPSPPSASQGIQRL